MAKGIDGFVVRTQKVGKQAKGLVEYGSYLKDMKHRNHAGKTDAIIPIYGNMESFLEGTIREAIALDLKNSANKGGRPVASYAQSFVLTLPSGVKRPTAEEWKKVATDVLKASFDVLGKTPAEMKGRFFANVHDQSNPHLNILIPKVIDGESQRKLNQARLLTVMKKAYSESLIKHCGIDYRSYQPLEVKRGKALPKWQYDQKKKVDSYMVEIEQKRLAISAQIENFKRVSKLTLMIQNQLTKWMNAVVDNDEKQKERQENRLQKSVSQLGELNIPKGQLEELDEVFEVAEKQVNSKLPLTVSEVIRGKLKV